MRVIDIFTGRDLSAEEIGARALAAAPERAAREALRDARTLIVQLAQGRPREEVQVLNHAIQALNYAAESNGLEIPE